MQYSLRALLVITATVAIGLAITMPAGVACQTAIIGGLVLMWFGLALCGWGASAFYQHRFLSTVAVLTGPLMAAAGLCLASLACSAVVSRLWFGAP
ncbi:MAG: hypothetical protein KatS3mg110_0816 [Pirellulaceae bacterium]|nr:MAG: hypothetical protein KatS3mg110_0816 [Pirellulaceae bacterium]